MSSKMSHFLSTSLSAMVLSAVVAVAAWIERDFAVRHWPLMWVAFQVDLLLDAGPNLATTPDTPSLEPSKRYEVLLTDLTARVAAARKMPLDDLVDKAQTQRDNYWRTVLANRVLQFVSGNNLSSTIDPLSVDRLRDQILAPLERDLELQRRWLTEERPSQTELSERLQGRRQIAGSSLVADKRGVVRVLAELERKATYGKTADAVLGRAVSMVAAGFGLLFFALALLKKPTWWVPLLAAPVMGATLVHVAVSLGALELRDVALRQLAGMSEVWWPLIAALGGVALAAIARADHHLGTLCVRYQSSVGIACRALLLALVAAAVAVFIKGDSLRAEAWLMCAVFALGCFGARNASFMVATGHHASYGWQFVIGVACVVTVAAAMRNDLGTVILTLGTVSAWVLMFSHRRVVTAWICVAVGLIVWWQGQLRPMMHNHAPDHGINVCTSPLVGWLPGSKKERLETACDPTIGTKSDVARSLWQARAGIARGFAGSGMVALPAQGLSAERQADRVIMQGPSDFFTSALVAVFGWVGFGLIGFYAVGLTTVGSMALATLKLGGRTDMQHLIAATSGFACIAAALRTSITFGGASAGIALTGLPAPLMSFGFAAAVTTGFALGAALGSMASYASAEPDPHSNKR